MRDHPPLVISEFRGTYDRGEEDTTPVGFFLQSENIQFIKGGIARRDGFEIYHGIGPVNRMAIYKRQGETQRLLMLDNRGNLWDSVTNTVILSIPGMTDFATVTMYDRAYISPHNGKIGLPGEKVYIYEGSGVARPAAGPGPGHFPSTNLTLSTESGVVEAGYHGIAVAYETVSGYISPYGAYGVILADGEHKVDITDIPVGPAGTVARILLASKAVPTDVWDGYLANQTYYTIPNGRIPDNTTTTFTIDGYDSSLVEEMSYLAEQEAAIPAGVGISEYKARMIVWGENANSSIIRASMPGIPESHSSIEGFATVNPGDAGGGLKYCFEYRNQLICCKSQRSYVTQDNGDSAATWEVGEIDTAIGTECHGVGRTLDFGENVEDRVFVCDRSGIRLFEGTFSDTAVISYNIDDIWSRINPAYFHTIEICLDPVSYRIYVAVPLDNATTPNVILYGDYGDGVGETEIRWTLWKFPKRPTTICVDVVNSISVFKWGSIDSHVYQVNKNIDHDYDVNEAPIVIHHFVEFPFLPAGVIDETVNHYTGIRMRIRGTGVLQISMRGLDSVNTLNATSLTLVDRPGMPYFRGFNFTSEHCAIRLGMDTFAGYFIMSKFILYMSPVWDERPVLS